MVIMKQPALLFLDFSRSYSPNNKANWQLRKRKKGEKPNNLFLICLGLYPRFGELLGIVFSECSEQILSFEITSR